MRTKRSLLHFARDDLQKGRRVVSRDLLSVEVAALSSWVAKEAKIESGEGLSSGLGK